MNKKSFFIFFSLLCVMLISSLASGTTAAGSTVAVTDPSNDVTVYAWDTSLNAADVKTDQSKPVIDITSISYGTDSNGNITIGLTVAGTPVFNNETFYWVTLDGDNLTAQAWGGAFDTSSTDCSQSCSWISTGDSYSLDYQNNSAVISGSTITWTFPRQVAKLNSTFQYEMVDLNLPDTPNATWTWDAITWTGTTAYATSQTSGTWWEDTLGASSSNDTTDTNSTSKGLPGLDFVSVVGVLTISSVVATLVELRKKKYNK